MNRKQFIESFGKSDRKTAAYTFDNHLDVVNHIDNCFLKFSILANRIRYDENSTKNVYLLAYATSIANNFIIIKQLFVTGYHFQMEVIQRTQIEQLNNLLTMIYDDEFFKFFTKTWVRNSEDFLPLTPKEKHLAKAIKKIEFKNPNFSDIFTELYDSIQETYEEFSKSVHGNFMHILLLTTGRNDDGDPVFVKLGDETKFLQRSIKYLIGVLDYSQIIWLLLESKFPKAENEDMFGNSKLLDLSILAVKYPRSQE
jgi:hypothetical protein